MTTTTEKVSTPGEPAVRVISTERWLREHLTGDEQRDVLVYTAHGACCRLAEALLSVDRAKARADQRQAEYDAALAALGHR